MFYQELYQLYNDMEAVISEELISNIDKWLALMPENTKDMITVGRVSSKFSIEYSIARALLEKLCDVGILKRIFEIHCPECDFILKVSDEDNLYYDILEIKSHIVCYNCDEDIEEITAENIEVRYKLIKKPTNDPRKIRKSINELFDIDESKYSKNTINKILEENKYNSNRLFYKPTEEEYAKLDELFCGFINAENTKDKGVTLEDFVEYLLNRVKPVEATKDAETNTNQLDCLAVNNSPIQNDVLMKMGHTFICECKNENKTPANGYYHKLANILNISRKDKEEHKFGIIFSKKRPPATYLEMAKKNFYTTNITIITFFKDELEEIVYGRRNLLGYIDYKINLVQQDLKENEETKKIFV